MNTVTAAPPISTTRHAFVPCWHNIRWQPNTATGEVLNIGVVHRDAAGAASIRLLDTFDRIRCLYDDDLAEQAKFLVDLIREATSHGIDDLPSPQVFLSEPKAASPVSDGTLLDALYQATVPLARPRQIETKLALPDERPQGTDSIRMEVFNAVRRLAGVKAEHVLSSEESMEVQDGARMHYLDIPLQARTALGTVVSARQRSWQKAEIDIGRAETDLLVARSIYRKDRLLMYVVRARDGAHKGTSAEAMDDWFDRHAWKLRRIGVELKASTSPADTAREIIEDLHVLA